MEYNSKLIAENIQKYRKKSGLTQESLAEKLGVTFQAVSKWENAKQAPDIMLLPLMAEAFGCSIDDLFSYIPENKRADLTISPDLSVPDELKGYVSQQIKFQLDNKGSTNKLLNVITDNLDGKFELNEENIERLLDAYREMYMGLIKK